MWNKYPGLMSEKSQAQRDLIDEACQKAMRQRQAWMEGLFAIAIITGCRVAISSRVKYPLARDYDEPLFEIDMVYDHVMLQPGEMPPTGRAWTIYELRQDIGWQGRKA